MKQKLFYLDVETSGLDPQKHGIIQISGEIEINGKTKEKFNWRVSLFKSQKVSSEALEITGTTVEQIRGYEDPIVVFKELKEMLEKYVSPYNKKDKFFMVGYNSHKFDSEFFRASSGKHNL